ncbi:MAG: hypothetical protein ABW026_08685 [Microvirga sp.]
MNLFRTLKSAYAGLCDRIAATSDQLAGQNDGRQKRLDAYNARYPKALSRDEEARPRS